MINLSQETCRLTPTPELKSYLEQKGSNTLTISVPGYISDGWIGPLSCVLQSVWLQCSLQSGGMHSLSMCARSHAALLLLPQAYANVSVFGDVLCLVLLCLGDYQILFSLLRLKEQRAVRAPWAPTAHSQDANIAGWALQHTGEPWRLCRLSVEMLHWAFK